MRSSPCGESSWGRSPFLWRSWSGPWTRPGICGRISSLKRVRRELDPCVRIFDSALDHRAHKQSKRRRLTPPPLSNTALLPCSPDKAWAPGTQTPHCFLCSPTVHGYKGHKQAGGRSVNSPVMRCRFCLKPALRSLSHAEQQRRLLRSGAARMPPRALLLLSILLFISGFLLLSFPRFKFKTAQTKDC